MTVPEIVQHEIREGERIAWFGQPIQGVRLQPMDWFLIPFTMVWALLPALVAIGSIRQGGPANLLNAAFCLLLVAAIVFGRFFVDAWLRARRYYAITDRRAISIVAYWRVRVESVLLRRLPTSLLVTRRSGVGQIFFGSVNPAVHASMVLAARFSPASFKSIPDAHGVFRIVVSTQRDLTKLAS